MSQEEKAVAMYEKAQKKEKSFQLFGNTKYEDAADMYTQAANLFKLAKKWENAGEAYVRSADCQMRVGSKFEAATQYTNAAGCYKKTSTADAIKSLRLAIDLYTDEGRFSMAAKHMKEVGELYEGDMQSEEAIEAFRAASDFYEGEGSTSAANSCLMKVAYFSAQLEKYDAAIEIYEKVASTSIDNNMLKWSVKDYFLRSGLCHLAKGDVVAAKRALERYQDMDVSFSTQRECRFLTSIIEAVESYNVDDFTNAVVEFDSISKLDSWKTSILLRIKNALKQEDSVPL